MSQADLYLAAAVGIMMVGLYGVFTCAHLLRKLIALNLFGSGIFLLYVAVARRVPGELPDPVPHAMVLTGLVISISATALGLILARRVKTLTGHTELPPALEPDP